MARHPWPANSHAVTSSSSDICMPVWYPVIRVTPGSRSVCPPVLPGPRTNEMPQWMQEEAHMEPSILEPMPAPVEEKIEPYLDEDEQPCVSVFTDMTTHGQFRGGWLVATDRRLIAVT